MVSGLSSGQREELEVQALIYKHVICGASIPPQLLLLFNKTLNNNSVYSSLSSSSTTSPYSNYLQHYYYQYPSLMQTGGGYWGRGGMDPEPGRCRRTDGKKWRCSKDVVAGHKYCDRHVHRGRNRSRKPVEIPTATTIAATLPPLRGGGGGDAGVGLKTGNTSNAAIAAQSFDIVSGSGGSSHFLQNSVRSSDTTSYVNKYPFRTTQTESSNSTKSGDRILRHFFDDWPKSEQDENNGSSSMPTGLSISMPENSPSDFSLKLSTGGNNNISHDVSMERERSHLNWGSYSVGSMGGGPLAEALRSSSATSNSSPTSVLHQLQRGSVSETSFITS